MPGAGLPQVSAGWVLTSRADAVPAPGSPRANRARVASCVCRGACSSCLHGWQIKPACSQRERAPKTAQGKKPHRAEQTDRYCTQIPFMGHGAIQL